MKKLFALVLTIVCLTGCLKTEYSGTTGIQYVIYNEGNYWQWFYNVSRAILEESEPGQYVLTLDHGNYKNYTDPTVTTAFYTALTVRFDTGGEPHWEGKRDIEPSSGSKMDYSQKGYQELEDQQWSHSLTNGTLEIKRGKKDMYEIKIESYTSLFMTPLTAYYHGTLLMPKSEE